MDKPEEKASKKQGSQGSPMQMGMAMAKKMVSQMGQGGSPFEMMQKMMAHMGEGGKPPSMDKMMGMCMGMCSEMLNAIRQTNALAVHATPELRQSFEDWLKTTEDEVVKLVESGTVEVPALATALKLSEDSVRYLLNRLGGSGKLVITARAK